MDDRTPLAGAGDRAALEPVVDRDDDAAGTAQLDELRALRAELRASEQQLARLPALEHEARLAAADRVELDALRARVEVLEADADDLRARLARASSTIDQMDRSLSWRMTAPLRALKRATRRG
jgi:uncharacterized protein involved in exopolysaccharide biosynthesis